MALYFAEELTAPEFSSLISSRTIGILPVAAIEPHGPHLPLSTDCDIAHGHLAQLAQFVSTDIEAIVLPMQTIGHSIEHSSFLGTFSHEAEILLASWWDVAQAFFRAGGCKLIIVSSHGGNSEVVGLLIARLRAKLGMLAVSAAWLRFGQPQGLFGESELVDGIHGGAIETSLMLHYWPEKVRRDQLSDFTSNGQEWDSETAFLKVHGRTRMGWMSHDLNVAGAVGNATAASAEKGAASAQQALEGFAALLADVAKFEMERLGDK
ncbi:creatininase family protein [Devosia rhodophyticola]|uniref:Creatininase family protein n=1 Tax=Devosia rhodophyticola TaxID=3026423 RepID=A0ABY7YUU7_9HYPH|nr:creatininase family protein [Devosia rhodophyticola]WDR05096.1 creatininase family protein [Devosia rhodophyticola]